MLKTVTITELRAELPSYIKGLEDGPVMIMSHSRPAAVLIDPEIYEALVEKIELIEDLVDGRRAMADYRADPDQAVDAEEVFERSGH